MAILVMKTSMITKKALDGRVIAERNELSVLELVRNYGHVRRSEIARAIWPESSELSAKLMTQRTITRILKKGLLLERPNALGGKSLVLGARGVAKLKEMGIDAQDGLDLSSVAGPQFFHRTLGTRYLIERAAQGHSAYGEYALSKGWAPVARTEFIERFGKIPDGIVTVPAQTRGYDTNAVVTDWLEVESSFKSPEELDRIFGIAWQTGAWLNSAESVMLDRVLFVYDSRQRHEHAIINALARYLKEHHTPNEQIILSSIILVRCEISIPLVWRKHEEFTALELLNKTNESEEPQQ